MRWITAADITDWANTNGRQCQEKLPELIRRLVLASAVPQRIDFPCDSSVTTGGWDGHLETTTQFPYYPDGVSKWEIGTERSTESKASKDYDSRKADPLGAIPSETTYVAVSPRQWPTRSAWESKKRAENHWKTVRAIGADELEQWIASAPGVGIWLARLIGKTTPGMRDIQSFWDEWSICTNPALTPGVVISGRIDERDDIHRWLANQPGIYQMQGDDPDEPLAFLYASIATLDEDKQEPALMRTVIVETREQMRACCETFTSPLIISAPGDCIETAPMAVAKGHHVFLRMDAKLIDIGRTVRLQRPKRDPMQKALEEAGLSEADAQKYLRNSGRSIPVLRRRLFRAGIVKTPAWAEMGVASTVLPALLAGAWMEGKEGDQEIIEALSGVTYTEFLKQLGPMAAADDTPIRKVGNVWMLKSPLDAWFLVAHHLDADHFERFRKAISGVLTETDPKYDLPSEKRWMAGLYGKTSKNSEWIRRGLVESLVLLSVYGERISRTIDGPQDFADSVVREILDGANSWEAWASLKDIMPLLAEAAPDTFLDVLEEKIKTSPLIFSDLMRDEPHKYGFGDCQHSGLLWALESIAWHPDYVTSAARALTSLAIIDPGGKWSNRPLSSLVDILLPGIPQTYATPEEKLATYDMIIKKSPEIAWKIADGHFNHSVISPSHTFRWRDAGGDRAPLSGELQKDYIRYVNGLLPRWSDLAVSTKDNISAAVQDFLRLPDDVRSSLLSTLKSIKPSDFSKGERDKLLDNLRHTLNWINNYDKEEKYQKALPTLKKAYTALTPADTLERVDWLFANGWPQLPDEPQASKDHEQKLVEIRRQAARDLLDDLPLSKVLDYGETLNYQGIFSSSLAKANKTKKEDSILVDALIERISKYPWLLVGYSMGKVEDIGDEWAIDQIERIKKNGNYTPQAAAALLRGMPEKGATWEKVASYGEEVEHAYWKWASGYSRSEESKVRDSIMAVDKLLSVERPEAALPIAGNSNISLPSELLKRVLLDLLKLSVDKKKVLDGTMLEFYLNNIFNQLYEREELSLDEIGALEWPYAQVFERHHRPANSPMALHRTLQKDPAFFVELMSHLYKKDDGTIERPKGTTEEQAKNIAENAQEILSSWTLVPGLMEDGSVDEKALNTWVDDARKIAESKGYLKGCDLKLADVLAKVPSDKDGMWPHTALRNTIERIESPLLEKHIPYAIYNSRGVRTRKAFEGGEKERELAKTYKEWSRSMRAKWPRTAKILKFLGDMFDRDAKHEDIDSQLTDLEY